MQRWRCIVALAVRIQRIRAETRLGAAAAAAGPVAPRPLMLKRELAAFLKVTERTIEKREREGLPSIHIGVAVRYNLDDVLAGAVTQTSSPAPAVLTAYRQVLALVGLFAKAAAFLDPVRQELVFVQDGKVPVPVRYEAATLQAMNSAAVSALIRLFSDDIHEDQRLSILAATIATTCSAQPANLRFRFVLENLDTLVREVRDGYRLFASEFTYAKIRRDVETAQFDYLCKIHKTFTDIQGQLLGIPVATIIVTSQLKIAHECDLDFWADLAVLSGAWIFVVLVAIAIAN